MVPYRASAIELRSRRYNLATTRMRYINLHIGALNELILELYGLPVDLAVIIRGNMYMEPGDPPSMRRLPDSESGFEKAYNRMMRRAKQDEHKNTRRNNTYITLFKHTNYRERGINLKRFGALRLEGHEEDLGFTRKARVTLRSSKDLERIMDLRYTEADERSHVFWSKIVQMSLNESRKNPMKITSDNTQMVLHRLYLASKQADRYMVSIDRTDSLQFDFAPGISLKAHENMFVRVQSASIPIVQCNVNSTNNKLLLFYGASVCRGGRGVGGARQSWVEIGRGWWRSVARRNQGCSVALGGARWRSGGIGRAPQCIVPEKHKKTEWIIGGWWWRAASRSRAGVERAVVCEQESSGTAQESSGTAQESSGTAQESSGTEQESSGTEQESSGTEQESSGRWCASRSGIEQESSGTVVGGRLGSPDGLGGLVSKTMATGVIDDHFTSHRDNPAASKPALPHRSPPHAPLERRNASFLMLQDYRGEVKNDGIASQKRWATAPAHKGYRAGTPIFYEDGPSARWRSK
ncbi:hypothetical protein T492DRAFT_840406 [Pavlovales sp. CCMP2436]|nr:hypothetical protein T492DRAFT_840406 [Pavlovales sp. CCMP2436]